MRNPNPTQKQLQNRTYMRLYMATRRAAARRRGGRPHWLRMTSEQRSLSRSRVRVGYCTRCGISASCDPCHVCTWEIGR